MSSCDKIVPSILQPLSQFGNGCGSLWRKSRFPLHYVPYLFKWRGIWGSESCCKQTVTNSLWLHCRCNMGPDFFHACSSGGHRCSHDASMLTCICITRPSRTWSTGVGMFDRLLLKAATHHRYIVPNMCNSSICPSSFPQAYNTTPFKWLKLYNRSTLSGRGCKLK